MSPQELKNSILQLAIQGKLVPQRAEEKINKAEKIILEETPFDIPENWGWQTLDTCCDLYTGNSISEREKKEKYEGRKDGFDYIGTKDVLFNQKIVYDNGIKIPYENNFKRAYDKTILLCIEGGSAGRKIAILDKEVCFGNKLCAFNANKIFYKFLFYYLQSNEFKKVFIENRTGIIGGVSIKKLKNIILPNPPLAEQKRIVAKIEELLPYVEQYEKAYNELQELDKRFPGDLQKSILQLSIQGRLVPQRAEEGNAEELYEQIQAEKKKLIKEKKIKKEKPLPEITDDEKPFDIPETWKWVRLGDVTILNPKNNLDDNLKTAFIPMALISDGYLSKHTSEIRRWSDIKKGFTHFANDDIGVAKITPCFQNKKSVIFSNLENGYGAGTTELSIIRVIHNLLLQKFVLWFVKTEYFIKNGVKSFTGTAGQQRIHKDYLKNCLLPLPPLAEQKRIVAKIEELLPLCDKLKN